jgi:hypothetical protein
MTKSDRPNQLTQQLHNLYLHKHRLSYYRKTHELYITAALGCYSLAPS